MATTYTADYKWAKPFSPRTKEPTVLGTKHLVIHAKENLSNQSKVFTFDFPTLSEFFFNLDSVQLFVKGELRHGDNTAIEKGEEVALANAPLYSLFSSVQLTFGENQEVITYNDYPFLSLFQICDKFYENSRSNFMTGFVPDDGLKVEGTTTTVSLTVRQSYVKESKSVIFMGKMFTDILNIDSYLLKNTPLSIQLTKAPADFYVCAKDETKSYNFVIKDIQLHVDMIKPNPKLSDVIETQMKTSDAVYSFDHLTLKKFNVPDNVFTHIINRVWSGVIPRRFAFALISEEAYQGRTTIDPMSFDSSALEKITLKINGSYFENLSMKDGIHAPYLKMLQFLQTGDESFINSGIFDKSLKLFCFDLNVMCDNEQSCANEITPSGTLSVELSFKKATEKPFILFMYSFNEGKIQIDNKRIASITVNHA